MDLLNPESLMWFLAQEAPKEGFLSRKVIIIVVVLLVVVGGLYWYRSRGK
jgi:hypothetical protein